MAEFEEAEYESLYSTSASDNKEQKTGGGKDDEYQTLSNDKAQETNTARASAGGPAMGEFEEAEYESLYSASDNREQKTGGGEGNEYQTLSNDKAQEINTARASAGDAAMAVFEEAEYESLYNNIKQKTGGGIDNEYQTLSNDKAQETNTARASAGGAAMAEFEEAEYESLHNDNKEQKTGGGEDNEYHTLSRDKALETSTARASARDEYRTLSREVKASPGPAAAERNAAAISDPDSVYSALTMRNENFYDFPPEDDADECKDTYSTINLSNLSRSKKEEAQPPVAASTVISPKAKKVERSKIGNMLSNKRFTILVAFVLVLTVIMAACFVAVFVEIAKLKENPAEMSTVADSSVAQVVDLQQLNRTFLDQVMDTMYQIIVLNNTLSELRNRVSSLNDHIMEQLSNLTESTIAQQNASNESITEQIAVNRNFTDELSRLDNQVANNSARLVQLLNLSEGITEQVSVNQNFTDELSRLDNQVADNSARLDEASQGLFDLEQRVHDQNFLDFEGARLVLNESLLMTILLNLIEDSNGTALFISLESCADLPSSSPSGYYWVVASDGSAVRVYCDMDLSCGNITGGWMRVAELNMTDTSQQCPSNLVERNDSNIRRCQIMNSRCSPTAYSTSINYTKVCGRSTGYQVGSTNAFRHYYEKPNITINFTYVDGISLTHGDPRQHIWTFAAALDRNDNVTGPRSSRCPCRFDVDPFDPPQFVGEDYFCDAGNEEFMTNETGLQTDPLWDGADCLCCASDNPPWFYKQLPQPTTDDIEMRVCRDEVSSNENIGIQEIEIFIQ